MRTPLAAVFFLGAVVTPGGCLLDAFSHADRYIALEINGEGESRDREE